MSKTSRKKVLAGSAIIALGLILAGANAVNASSVSSGGPTNSLVSALAIKFNLRPSDVQAVFDEQRAAMEKEREQAFADRVKAGIRSGTLTQDQADKIITKKAELETLKASFSGKTQDEIRSSMKTQMDSLKHWAADNNIPAEYMMFGGPIGGIKMFSKHI